MKTPMYQIWARKLNHDEWNPMSYMPRSKEQCEFIIEEYTAQFGDTFEYRCHTHNRKFGLDTEITDSETA